ncbi:Rne/Rng family ribonuclease [Rubrivirga sp. IMCC45206]|uniref:Rne/Rng family ribonuclease n=1 Tax=Rubrivirga sp. IMCC45206 TaxID=3391614 RepID=UPI00398F8E92
MKKQIIINASKDRSRIAIVEDGELVELYVENPDNVRTIGNVYLGRIQKVMPAIRAAFVDVGEKQDCFLHFSDLTDNLPQLIALAGEDVPGLDAPVLSLAPPKRIAEDDSEPDVEDALEVSPGDSGEVTEESRTKSRSGGRSRSRGRGRGRGGRGRGRGRREEEEEQEERRPLRGVIDLSSPSKPRRTPRPKPTPEPEEEPETIDPPAPVDETPEAEAPEVEEAPTEETPKTRRRSRAKTAEPEAGDDAEAETPEPDAEEKPKSRRRSRASAPAEGAGEADREPGAAEASAADSADEDSDDSDEASGEAKPKRRRRRGRRGRGRGKSSEGDASDEDASPGKGRRRNRSAAPADDASETSGRKRSDDDAGSDDSGDANESTPKSRTRDSDDGGGRSRRGKGADDADTSGSKDAKPKGSKKKDGARKDGDKKGGRKRLPSTVDLSGSSRSNLRVIPEHHRDDDDDGDRTQAPEDARSGEAGDQPDGRSRRRSRSEDSDGSGRDRGGRRSKTADDDSEGSDDTGRSRGGRRSKKADAGSDDRGGRSRRSDKNDDGGSDGRSRRRTRSGDDATAESDGDKPVSGRSQGGRSSREGDRGGRDSNRGSRDGDRGGRSSSRDGNRDSGRGGRDTNRQRSKASGRIPSNEELIKRDGKIIVKITKEAISNKGPRVSTDLSLAGRFLVLVPAADYVAVSKKIESAKERRRLRTLATSLKPDGFGVIVRTVAEGRDAKSLDTDLRLLTDKWRKIENKLKGTPEPPVLLYQDVNMVSSVIRDLFSEDYDRILVDDPKVFANVQAYVKAVAPQMADKVEMHKGRTPVYRSLGIEKQVEEAFSKRVNMRGGGYLFIETTEAMHVVDVNSGRAGRGKSQKQNLIDVNVEAAREVAKQLRLRDLGGIIVVDFIDLKYDRDRKKVTDVLLKAFEKDRAVTKLLPMSDFGLVQITRQRLRPSITANATDEDGNPLDAAEAVAAAGAGEIQRSGNQVYEADERDDRPARSERAERSERPVVAAEDATPRALAGRIRGWLDHYRATVDERYKSRPIVVRVHPLLGAFLRRGLVSPLTRWRLGLRGIAFEVEDDTSVDPLAFDIRDQKSGRSLLKKYAA